MSTSILPPLESLILSSADIKREALDIRIVTTIKTGGIFELRTGFLIGGNNENRQAISNSKRLQ